MIERVSPGYWFDADDGARIEVGHLDGHVFLSFEGDGRAGRVDLEPCDARDIAKALVIHADEEEMRRWQEEDKANKARRELTWRVVAFSSALGGPEPLYVVELMSGPALTRPGDEFHRAIFHFRSHEHAAPFMRGENVILTTPQLETLLAAAGQTFSSATMRDASAVMSRDQLDSLRIREAMEKKP